FVHGFEVEDGGIQIPGTSGPGGVPGQLPTHGLHMLRKNGETFPIWLEVGRAEVDGVPMFVGCLQDITERKRAEEEIRKLSLAVEQSPSVVIITNLAREIIYVNPRFTEVTGYDREEVLGRTPRMLNSGHSSPEEYRELWRTILEGKVWRGELLNRKKDGFTYWAAVAMVSIRDAQGAISGFVAVQEDVTLRKEAEMALIKAKETAEEANRAKSEFLNTMSHELRTPLTVILGYLPLLRQPHLKLPPARKLIQSLGTGEQADMLSGLLAMIAKMAGEMHRNGDHLLTLINDLLDISKIEAGKLTLNPEVLQVQPLVVGVMDALRVKADEKGLTLLVHGGANMTVWADEVRFKQILLNLVGNAVKFTESGEIRVEMSIQGEMAEFVVIDSGPGIPPDELEKVFERFHQVDNSSTRKAGGTGLGLAITRKLVLLSGGEIRVESRLGEGASFRFTLPMKME
ncbi:MAG: ATP-binding protein, partial [Magnetococcus sp. YQC-5]